MPPPRLSPSRCPHPIPNPEVHFIAVPLFLPDKIIIKKKKQKINTPYYLRFANSVPARLQVPLIAVTPTEQNWEGERTEWIYRIY